MGPNHKQRRQCKSSTALPTSNTKRKSLVRGPWLNAETLGAYLGFSERAIRELEYRGKLPGRRVKRTLRFGQGEIDQWLLQNRIPANCEIVEDMPLPVSPVGPLVNLASAAGYLSITTKALEHRIYRKQVPYYRIGKQYRFSLRELDAILVEQSLTPYSSPLMLEETPVCRERS